MLNLEIAKLCFKFKNNLLPSSLSNLYTSTNLIHSHNTRSSQHSFFLNRQNSSQGLCSLSYLGTKLWSTIPINIKNSKTLSNFTVKMKLHLLSNYKQSSKFSSNFSFIILDTISFFSSKSLLYSFYMPSFYYISSKHFSSFLNFRFVFLFILFLFIFQGVA